jgi:hypothetical protein
MYNPEIIPIDHATKEMDPGLIDDIERKARTEVATLEGGGKAKGGPEAGLYGDIAMGALGLPPVAKFASSAISFLDERLTGGGRGINVSPDARTIDDDIRGSKRTPGVYNALVEPKIYEKAQFAGESLAGHKKSSYGTVGDRNCTDNIKSLNTDGVSGLSKKMEGAKHALTLRREAEFKAIYGPQSQAALNSVDIARKQQYGMAHRAAQMTPGMNLGLGSGPRPRNMQALISETWKDEEGRA